MKKKILTIALVCAMMSAAAITVNAEPITPQTSDPKNGSTDVSYQVDPTYTITIPESVTLSKDNTVNADITAADVLLEKGKKITVTLTGASNTTTANATTFNAKNNTSVATYTITAGSTAVALGDEVASFTTDGTQALTFSKANTTDVIYAGAHTETLTFTIAVADVPGSKTLAEQVTTDNSVVRLNFKFTAGGKTSDVYVDYTYNSGTFTRTGKSEEFSLNGNWKMTESNGVLTFTAVYAPFGDFILNYSSTINLNDLTYSESNAPGDEADAKWYITLTNIEVNSTPVTITNS